MCFSTNMLVCAVLILASVTGCELLPSNDEQQPPLALTDITRILWKLESFETNGTQHTLERYQPLHLIFADTTNFLGDDGCNSFSASYTTDDNRVHPENFATTLGFCGTLIFPVAHLAEPFEVKIEREDMTVVTTDGLYHYHSDYVEPIEGSPLIGGNWRLIASDDPAVQALEGEFVPDLTFDAERGYAIKWRCSGDNLFGCNEYSGFWGLGEGESLMLYQTSARVSNALHARTIATLGQVSSYRLESGELVLHSAQDSVVHRFERH